MEAKAIAVLVLIIAIGAAGLWWGHHRYDAGVTEGTNTVTVKWQRDKLDIQAAAAKELATMQSQRDAAVTANQGIINAYEQKLSADNASAANLVQRLQNALAAAPRTSAGGGGLQQGKSSGGSGGAAPGAAGSPERLTELLTAAAAECLVNDDSLDAIYAEVVRQQ